MAIDLTKDSGYQKNLCDIELQDNQGLIYKFKSCAKATGFQGYLAEVSFKKSEQEGRFSPRFVRLTDELVFLPNDLVQEFVANHAADIARKMQLNVG